MEKPRGNPHEKSRGVPKGGVIKGCNKGCVKKECDKWARASIHIRDAKNLYFIANI